MGLVTDPSCNFHLDVFCYFSDRQHIHHTSCTSLMVLSKPHKGCYKLYRVLFTIHPCSLLVQVGLVSLLVSSLPRNLGNLDNPKSQCSVQHQLRENQARTSSISCKLSLMIWIAFRRSSSAMTKGGANRMMLTFCHPLNVRNRRRRSRRGRENVHG